MRLHEIVVYLSLVKVPARTVVFKINSYQNATGYFDEIAQIVDYLREAVYMIRTNLAIGPISVRTNFSVITDDLKLFREVQTYMVRRACLSCRKSQKQYR